MGHLCPGGCKATVSDNLLACKPDWFRLPVYIRRAVNDAYRKHGPGSEAHRNAVLLAYHWYQEH